MALPYDKLDRRGKLLADLRALGDAPGHTANIISAAADELEMVWANEAMFLEGASDVDRRNYLAGLAVDLLKQANTEEVMSTKFVCGSSPIYEYPPDVPTMHPAGTCTPSVCPICTAQRIAVLTGRAKIIGECTWSGTESHSTLRRSFLDWLFGRPGKWVPD